MSILFTDVERELFFQTHIQLGTMSVSIKMDDEAVIIFAYAALKAMKINKNKENYGRAQIIVKDRLPTLYSRL